MPTKLNLAPRGTPCGKSRYYTPTEAERHRSALDSWEQAHGRHRGRGHERRGPHGSHHRRAVHHSPPGTTPPGQDVAPGQTRTAAQDACR